MNPYFGIFLVLSVFTGYVAMIVDGHYNQPGCSVEQEPGILTWRAWKVCERLQRICPALQSGSLCKSEANRLPWGKCNDTCPTNTKFCSLNMKCIGLNETCDLTSQNKDTLPESIPCNGNCSSNETFCPLLDRCIPTMENCSLKKLIDWEEAGNKSIGPYGEKCNENETYCLARWKCIDVSESCQVETNAVPLNWLCPPETQFCNSSMECVYNRTFCEPTNKTLNLKCADDFGTGWTNLCKYKETICRPRLAGAARCKAHIEKCFCGNGTYYCQADGGCILSNSTCDGTCQAGFYLSNQTYSTCNGTCEAGSHSSNQTNSTCNGTCEAGSHSSNQTNSTCNVTCQTGFHLTCLKNHTVDHDPEMLSCNKSGCPNNVSRSENHTAPCVIANSVHPSPSAHYSSNSTVSKLNASTFVHSSPSAHFARNLTASRFDASPSVHPSPSAHYARNLTASRLDASPSVHPSPSANFARNLTASRLDASPSVHPSPSAHFARNLTASRLDASPSVHPSPSAHYARNLTASRLDASPSVHPSPSAHFARNLTVSRFGASPSVHPSPSAHYARNLTVSRFGASPSVHPSPSAHYARNLTVSRFDASLSVHPSPSAHFARNLTVSRLHASPSVRPNPSISPSAANVFKSISPSVTPNNPPKIYGSKEVQFAIAYNTTVEPVQCRKIGNITDGTVSDTDGDKVGVALLRVPKSKYGDWMWRCNESKPFMPVDVIGYSEQGINNCFLLKPHCCIKFKPNGSRLWSENIIDRRLKVDARAWDGTDGKQIGLQNCTIPPDDDSSLSKEEFTFRTRRKGCDGQFGSLQEEDLCGECGGSNKCVGCDGVLNSRAEFDTCGNCTNTTMFNSGLDCSNETCGESYEDHCGVCHNKEFPFTTSCDGVCFGNATINSCGYCTGGNTSRPETFGQDACGVCWGDNSSCTDCEGVVNGGKVNDSCGDCKLKNDPSFNTGCIKLYEASPLAGPIEGGTNITVKGAGLKDKNTAECKFVKDQISLPAETTGIQKRERYWDFVVTSREFSDPGEYELNCTFDGVGLSHKVEEGPFVFYNISNMKLTSNSTIEVEVGSSPTNVTINGTGFVSTGYLKFVDESNDFRTDGYFVSETEVKCLMPTFSTSSHLDLSLVFSESATVSVKGVTLTAYVNAPSPESAIIGDELQKLEITFNSAAESDSETKTKAKCSLFIDSAESSCSLGEEADCYFESETKLVTSFGYDSNCTTGDTIAFKNDSVKALGEKFTKKKSGLANLMIIAPVNPPSLEVEIRGANTYGPCASINLEAVVTSGSGGRSVLYKWTVDGSPSDKADIEAELGNSDEFVDLNKTLVKLDTEYLFVLEVTNFLNQKKTSTFALVRERRSVPYLDVEKFVEARASAPTEIEANILMSPCLDPNEVANKVAFQWTTYGFTLDNLKNPYLYIKENTLNGGKSYRADVKAFMENNPSLAVTESVKINVMSSPLVAVVTPDEITVTELDEVNLDCSSSFDPNEESTRADYLWQCVNPKGQPLTDKSGLRRLQFPRTQRFKRKTKDMNMKPGQRYKCVCKCSKGQRYSTAVVTINAIKGDPPQIYIRGKKEKGKENPTKEIKVVAEIKTETNRDAKCEWECVCKSADFACIDLSRPGVTSTKVSFTVSGNYLVHSLVIKPNQLKPGAKYRFRLKCNYVGSSDFRKAGITVKTNAPPKQGNFKVVPSNGVAMETKFTLDASGGWDDKDKPLTFTYGCVNEKDEDNEIMMDITKKRKVGDLQLPAGQWECYVAVTDSYDATTRRTFKVAVSKKTLNNQAVTGVVDDAKKKIRSGNREGALTIFFSIAVYFDGSDSDDVSENVKVSESERSCKSLLDFGRPQGRKQKRRTSLLFKSLTKSGGRKFTFKLKVTIATEVVFLQLGISIQISSSKRRRRAVSPSPVEAKTPDEVKIALETVSNLIDPEAYDKDTMKLKSSFIEAVDAAGRGMCAGLVTGQPAVVGKNDFAAVRSEKNTFQSVDTVYIDTSCNGCGIKTTAKMLLGSGLKTQYQSWDCKSDQKCSGVCVVSSQYRYNLLQALQGSEPASLTNIVDLKLYNPSNHDAIEVSTLSSPVTFQLPLEYKNTTNFVKGTTNFECKRWVSSQWTSDGCVTTSNLVTLNTTDYIECKCTKLGFLAALVSSPSNFTQVSLEVHFKLEGTYDDIVSTHTKIVVETKTTEAIINKTDIEEKQIANLRISPGSIQVSFTLISNANHATKEALQILANQLKTSVDDGSFTVLLPNGKILTALKGSFVIGELPTEATVPPVDDKKGLSETEIIILAVVCSVVGLALLIIVIIIIKKKCGSSRKIRDSPNASGVENAELSGYGKLNQGLQDEHQDDERFKPRQGLSTFETDRV